MRIIKTAAASLLTLTLGSPAFAQQGSPQMNMQGHGMGNMDMQTMMNQCAQMRQQMRPGARMTAEMQNMMQQCDEMDRQMGSSTSGSAPAPRVRTR
jgi:hypothetical protein